ncbi:DNA repair protein RadA, partial [bacterium]|nr:DNA repair protein RadA [bacterium]
AVASSFRDVSTPPRMVALGEVGLGGEVRAVTRPSLRIREAARLGFTECLIGRSNLMKLKQNNNIKLIGVGTVAEALDIALSSP